MICRAGTQKSMVTLTPLTKNYASLGHEIPLFGPRLSVKLFRESSMSQYVLLGPATIPFPFHKLFHFVMIHPRLMAIDFLKPFRLSLDQGIILHLSYCIDYSKGSHLLLKLL